jgi:hypothetical protein
MKKSHLLAGIILLAATACSNESEQNVVNPGNLVPVTVHVNDFSMSVEDFPGAVTRAPQSVDSYEGVKAITLAFYKGDTEVCSSTQLRADNTTYTTFGQFELSLLMGSYTMVVLGYGSADAMTLTNMSNATFHNDRVRETFVYTQDVNVTSTAALDLNATLSRVVAKLEVRSTDERTANAAKLRTTFAAGGDGVNPMTGLSTTNTGFSNTVDLNGEVGKTVGSVNYLFLNTDQQSMTVTIDVLDADDNSVSHKVVNNVPLQRNKVTRLSGHLFTADDVTAAFQIETAWLGDVTTVEF